MIEARNLMAAIRAGVLSDTHLRGPDQLFRDQAAACFADVDIIEKYAVVYCGITVYMH